MAAIPDQARTEGDHASECAQCKSASYGISPGTGPASYCADAGANGSGAECVSHRLLQELIESLSIEKLFPPDANSFEARVQQFSAVSDLSIQPFAQRHTFHPHVRM